MTATPQSPIGQSAPDTDGSPGASDQPSRSGRRARRRGRFLPVTVSVLALLVSLGSAAVALMALDRANYARDFVLAGRDGQEPSVVTPAPAPSTIAGTDAPPAPSPAETATPIDPTSTTVPELNPETRYNVKYEKEVLDLQWPTGCSSSELSNIDLDEPRVIVSGGPGVDLSLGQCSNANTPNFRLQGGSQGALITSADATPRDCAERIQKGPLLPDTNIPARQGQTFCVLTDFSAAQAAGDTRKMIRAEVKGVATNERISIEITAWVIP